MIPYIIGAVVLTIAVAAFLLSSNDANDNFNSFSSRRGGGRATDLLKGFFGILLSILLLVLLWGGGISCFVGVVCIILKIIEVEPVNTWTWGLTLSPILGGITAYMIGAFFFLIANE